MEPRNEEYKKISPPYPVLFTERIMDKVETLKDFCQGDLVEISRGTFEKLLQLLVKVKVR